MAYKIRKLKAVGIRQNAPQPRAMSQRMPALGEAVAIVGSGVLAFGVALTVLPRHAVAVLALAIAFAISRASAVRRAWGA